MRWCRNCGLRGIVSATVLTTAVYLFLIGPNSLGQCHRTLGGTTMQMTVASVFTYNNDNNNIRNTTAPQCALPGGSRVQKKLCRKDPGAEAVIERARRLAQVYCKETFRYERWNCDSPVISFQKVYRETALLHAMYAAALTYSVSRGCGEGSLSSCHCAAIDNDREQTRRAWMWGGCGDNFRYGKSFTRRFLQLRHAGDDLVAQLLKHNCEVGIKSLNYHFHEICKCHGISGSCQTKTCWRRLSSFQSIVNTLKMHYHAARQYDPGNRPGRPTVALKYSPRTLLYLENSPNFCLSTRGRQCLHAENCATLCCGRGFVTTSTTVKQPCECSWNESFKLCCNTCYVAKEMYTCK